MKKYLLLAALTGATISLSTAFAAEPTATWDPTLTQAKSCAEVESIFKEYFTSNWYGGYYGPLQGGVMVNDAATKESLNAGGM